MSAGKDLIHKSSQMVKPLAVAISQGRRASPVEVTRPLKSGLSAATTDRERETEAAKERRLA